MPISSPFLRHLESHFQYQPSLACKGQTVKMARLPVILSELVKTCQLEIVVQLASWKVKEGEAGRKNSTLLLLQSFCSAIFSKIT